MVQGEETLAANGICAKDSMKDTVGDGQQSAASLCLYTGTAQGEPNTV